MSAFRDHLEKHQYAPVTIPIPYAIFVKAADLFLRFLETVPDEEKRELHFKSPFERGSADGYSDKRDIEGKDPKEFVHFNRRFMAMQKYRACADTHEAAQAFFDTAHDIYDKVETAACAMLEAELPEYASEVMSDGALANATLRFLCYTPQDTIAFTAKPHYDKSFGTLTLAESTPGLRIGCCSEHPMQKVVHRDETALFMPGDLLFEDSKRAITPAWHDVVMGSVSQPISPRCGRWAIVFFIDPKDGRYSSWDAVHMPLPVHAEATAV